MPEKVQFLGGPSDEVLIALGRITLEFSDLEHWINFGIIETEEIRGAGQKKLLGQGFEDRVERLVAGFAGIEAKGWVPRGARSYFLSADCGTKLTAMGQERNDILHGQTFTYSGPPDETGARCGFAHAKWNPKHRRWRKLDKPTLDELTERISSCGWCLRCKVTNLCSAKVSRGIDSICMRPEFFR